MEGNIYIYISHVSIKYLIFIRVPHSTRFVKYFYDLYQFHLLFSHSYSASKISIG
nr:MAG TPA: hypothetical protein [Caudoviricetes sp.]